MLKEQWEPHWAVSGIQESVWLFEAQLRRNCLYFKTGAMVLCRERVSENKSSHKTVKGNLWQGSGTVGMRYSGYGGVDWLGFPRTWLTWHLYYCFNPKPELKGLKGQTLFLPGFIVALWHKTVLLQPLIVNTHFPAASYEGWDDILISWFDTIDDMLAFQSQFGHNTEEQKRIGYHTGHKKQCLVNVPSNPITTVMNLDRTEYALGNNVYVTAMRPAVPLLFPVYLVICLLWGAD